MRRLKHDFILILNYVAYWVTIFMLQWMVGL
jgi:hypothetical protein